MYIYIYIMCVCVCVCVCVYIMYIYDVCISCTYMMYIHIHIYIYIYISLGAWHGSDADCPPQQRAEQDASGGQEEEGAACDLSLAPQSVNPPPPTASVRLCEVDASAGGHAAPTIEEAWQVCSRIC